MTKPTEPQQLLRQLFFSSTTEKIEALDELSRIPDPSLSAKVAWGLDDQSSEVKKMAIKLTLQLLKSHNCARFGLAVPVLSLLNSVDLKTRDYFKLSKNFKSRLTSLTGEKISGEWLDGICDSFSKALRVSEFQSNPSLLKQSGFKVWIVVKRTDKSMIPDDQQRSEKRPDQIGRSTNRKNYKGLIVLADLAYWNSSEEYHTVYKEINEPYDLASYSDQIYLTSGNQLQAWNRSLEKKISHWNSELFSQLHSVALSKNATKILLASSGFDSVVEIDSTTAKVTWQWCAWQHKPYFEYLRDSQINISINSVIGSSNDGAEMHKRIVQLGSKGLPTQHRVHLNGASYDNAGNVAISLAQMGSCGIVSKLTGLLDHRIVGLRAPHSFKQTENGFLVADTQRGRILSIANNETEFELWFDDLPGLTNHLRDGVEWIQDVVRLTDSTLIVLDRARSCIWIVDIALREYRKIMLPDHWRAHRICLAV